MRRFFVAILGCLMATAVQAQAYKWLDEHGNVHYGDRPSPAQEVREVEVEPAEPAAAPTTEVERAERRRRLLDAYSRERQDRRERRQQEQEQRAEARRNCNIAKDRLRQIERASYLYDINEDGEREAYSEQQRAKAQERTGAEVRKWCE